MSQEMIKVSFTDWRAIGAELYKNNPEEFMKQAEAAGLDKESAIPWLGIGAGLLGYEALKGIGGWVMRQFSGSALPSFVGNYAAQQQAFHVMELLEQSPDLRETVVGAEKLHNRLQELRGTIVGLRETITEMTNKQIAKNREEGKGPYSAQINELQEKIRKMEEARDSREKARKEKELESRFEGFLSPPKGRTPAGSGSSEA
ncbi:MAG: hypothetical protein H8E55_46480 [Pelagibacterales bacterium]|nr:hypothetical protein [Pelagibacterales bacterium]